MVADMAKMIDECLARIKQGESIEKILADFPQIRKELEPLLKTAAALSSIPRVSPSEEFRRTSQAHLIQVLAEESRPAHPKIIKPTTKRRGFWTGLALRPLISVAVAILLILAISVSFIFFRGSAVAAEYTLSILSGNVEIQRPGSSGWQPGADGVNLVKDSRVRTAGNSTAVLTFIDGSTCKLEPDTEISVLTSEYQDSRSTRIILSQQAGKVWTNIQKSGDGSTDFQIRTPAANIAAQGTAFSTEVEVTGATKVIAVEGTVKVSAQEREVYLTTEQQTQVKPGAAPESPVLIATKVDQIIVSTNLAAVSSVLDPTGSSTGYLPNGLSFNQITNSKNELAPEGQRIAIDNPAKGVYSVVVRSVSQEAVPVDIQIKSVGNAAFEYHETLSGNTGNGWLLRIKLGDSLTAKDNTLAVEPLGDRNPEKIVETKMALERATPIAITPKASRTLSPIAPLTVSSPSPTKVNTDIATATVTSPTVTATPLATPTSSLTPVVTPMETQITSSPTPTLTPKLTDTTTASPTPIKNTETTSTPVVTSVATPKPVDSPTPAPVETTTNTTSTSTTSTGITNTYK